MRPQDRPNEARTYWGVYMTTQKARKWTLLAYTIRELRKEAEAAFVDADPHGRNYLTIRMSPWHYKIVKIRIEEGA